MSDMVLNWRYMVEMSDAIVIASKIDSMEISQKNCPNEITFVKNVINFWDSIFRYFHFGKFLNLKYAAKTSIQHTVLFSPTRWHHLKTITIWMCPCPVLTKCPRKDIKTVPQCPSGEQKRDVASDATNVWWHHDQTVVTKPKTRHSAMAKRQSNDPTSLGSQ